LVGADKKVYFSTKQGNIVQSVDCVSGVNTCSWLSENLLVFAADDGTIKLYDLVKDKILCGYRLVKGFPYCMDINRLNDCIVVGDTEGFSTSFHLSQKDSISKWLAHSATVTDLSFSTSYNELLTCSHDGTTREWIPSQKPLCLRTVVPVPKLCTSMYACLSALFLYSSDFFSSQNFLFLFSPVRFCFVLNIGQYS
jgi:WD40 repeat protein